MLLLAACATQHTPKVREPESADLPEALSEYGYPVGVRTVEVAGRQTEVWYPAADATQGQPEDAVGFAVFVSDAVAEVLGPLDFPPLSLHAVRDADLRNIGADYPAVVFSHGFGGVRVQSPDHAAHLASRGYVVLATDHSSRSFTSLLPCLFDPVLEGCDLTGFTSDDAAVAEVLELLDWIGANAGAWTIDTGRIGLSGHSAGGSTIVAAADDPRVSATLVMAAPDAPDAARHLLLGGSCDAFADQVAMEAVGAPLVEIQQAGHLAFSDLCELDLVGIADRVLAPRDDVNTLLLEQLYALARDGCPGATPARTCAESYLDLEISGPIVRHYAAAFFDEALLVRGPGPEAGVFPEAVYTE